MFIKIEAMESVKYITTHPHEMDDELSELYLDFIEKKQKATARDDPPRSRDFHRKQMKIEPHKDNIRNRYYAILDNKIIGYCFAGYTKRENDSNPDKMWIDVYVLKAYRRKGIGNILFEKILEFGKKVNRLTFDGGLYPIDGDDGPKFLEKKGILPKLNEKVSRLYKDAINWDFVNSSEKKLEEKLSKYKIESHNAVDWANRILEDDEYALQTADYFTEIETLIPMEDIERNYETLTIEDERRWAENTLKNADLWDNRNFYLLDGDRMIAMSGTYFPNDPPIKDVGTGLTGVRKDYQRQGIATYLKIKVLKYFVENHPDFKYIHTENAASNDGMLAINIALGFKPIYDWQMFQGKFNGIVK